MLFNTLLISLREIKRNLLRSFLTVLGVVIGVASVIAMVIIGDGTTAYVKNDISKLGTNLLTLMPGQERRGPGRDDNSAKPFSASDVNAIKSQITDLKAVAPNAQSTRNAVYGNKSYSTRLIGTNNDYFIAKQWEFDKGGEFDSADSVSGKAVCVLGQTVVTQLFGTENPVGNSLRLQTFSCRVIGTLKSKGAASFGMDQDDVIIVPINMLQRKVLGNKDISSILVSVEDEDAIENVKTNLTTLLRERRNIKKNETDDFYVRDMKDILNTMTSTTQTLTYLLSAIAAISLLVGGIGIMNIMLVSVTERTKEIGIRLAIGAMEREVLLQFLVESIVLSTLGGLAGIVFGIIVAYFGTQAFSLPFTINESIILVSFLFSSFIGILFGYFPARKAAKLKPIEALRHE